MSRLATIPAPFVWPSGQATSYQAASYQAASYQAASYQAASYQAASYQAAVDKLGRWLKARAAELRAQVGDASRLSNGALSAASSVLSAGQTVLWASGIGLSGSGVGALDLISLSEEAHDGSQVSEVDWADISKTLNGDGHAYGRIVSRYQDQITAQMWRLSRQRADCEQLVHEVFVEAYVSLRAYKGRAPFLHWLRRIATRVGYRYWKQQARLRRQSSVPIQDWHRSVEAANNDMAEQAASVVHTLLAELPPRDRMVLTLIYLEDCSVAEAAELSGWSQTMVKVQAHRARKKLKKLLDERQLDSSMLED